MQYLLIVTFLLLGCMGCKTTEYYTRPDSPGYYENHWGALCNNCNRVFTFSSYHANITPNGQCPYCGAEQNVQQANSSYVYEETQRKNEATRRAISDFLDKRERAEQQAAETSQRIYEKHMDYNQGLLESYLEGSRERRNRPKKLHNWQTGESWDIEY